MISFLAFVVALGVPTCHPVTADHIYGRDLAQVFPAFQALSPDLVVGLSPFPGQQRVFRPGELHRLALANATKDSEFLEGVCFSWPMSVPTSTMLQAAMEETLAHRNAHIEIVEQSRLEAPPGLISFPLSGLSGTADGPVLWRGIITYADKRTFTIWARVRVNVKEPHLVAAQTLKPGEEVRPDQLKVETYEGPLTREQYYRSPADVIGLTPRNSIASGLPLTAALLRERSEIERGDLVEVIVELKQTHLEAQGVAEESGHKGATILVRNARSGRKFRARIQDKGKVLVIPEGPTGLVTEESRHDTGN